jgi:hypothetical protein
VTEPTPVLTYRFSEYERKPFFSLLAIVALIMGICSEYASVAALIALAPRIGLGGKIDIYSIYFPGAVTNFFEIIGTLVLVAAAVAFLAGSNLVPLMLWAYVLVLLCSTLLGPIASLLAQYNVLWRQDGFLLAIYVTATFRHVVFDVVMLMLLRTSTVRQLIHAATGIKEATIF